MQTDLTKDAKSLFYSLYEWYLERLKEGKSRYDAKHFSVEELEVKFSERKREDLLELCYELVRADYLGKSKNYDNAPYQVWLNDKGIIYMENRFEDNVDKFLEYAYKVKRILPFN